MLKYTIVKGLKTEDKKKKKKKKKLKVTRELMHYLQGNINLTEQQSFCQGSGWESLSWRSG